MILRHAASRAHHGFRIAVPRPRAFTVLELMLAMTLALFVVGGVLSVFTLLTRADDLSEEAFEEAVDLSITQEVLRRAMQSLVAGRPAEPAEAPPAEDEGEPAEEEGEDEATPPEQESGEPTKLPGHEPADQLPHFELSEHETTGGAFLQRLELVVRDSPVAQSWMPSEDDEDASLLDVAATTSVRGAFELIELDAEWALVWVPIDPPGVPEVLVRDLDACRWTVLPKTNDGAEWMEAWEARDLREFPVAVRLVLWTRKGGRVDWLFETAVVVEGM